MATPQGSSPAAGGSDLERITARLREIAAELGSDPEEGRAAELVREASELADRVGGEVERATRTAADRGP